MGSHLRLLPQHRLSLLLSKLEMTKFEIYTKDINIHMDNIINIILGLDLMIYIRSVGPL